MSPHEQSTSAWMNTAAAISERTRQPLEVSGATDVCVIGAGIAGLTTAYLLSLEGRQVDLLDAGLIGGGQTERTTAHLSCAIDDWIYEVERIHGTEGARLAVDSHRSAIDRIQAIVQREQVACDFERVDGYLFATTDEARKQLQREYEAAHRVGLTNVELVERAPVLLEAHPALRFPRQAQFHPLKYLNGIARAAEQRDVQIYTNTRVAQVTGGDTCQIKLESGPTLQAKAVVVATNVPFNDWLTIHTKQAPYMTYAISLRVPAGSIPPTLLWDTEEPYHYVRVQTLTSDHDLLIVGGEDHKAGQATDQSERWSRLKSWASKNFAGLGPIRDQWSGMVMETTDGLAFIGPNPLDQKNVYIATGDSGMGMTHGTIAGILLTDLIQGRKNPWSRVYDPSRKPAWGMAWKEFLTENANVAFQLGKDWLSGSEVASENDILPNSGAVLRSGLSKVAVSRDAMGAICRRSAVCPHLGCIVHWNDAENSWDCPCHGSRFKADGSVLTGPANSPLANVDSQH